MRGLIKNNFYSLEGSLKIGILLGFIVMIGMLVMNIWLPNTDTLIHGAVSGILGAFGALAGNAIQKDGVSKRNKFELSLPTGGNVMIKARYISFFLYILVGIFMAILSVLLFYVVIGNVDLEKMGDGFVYGTAFAISVPAFTAPLVLLFGTDKNEGLLMTSIAASICLQFGWNAIFTPIFSNFSNADLVSRAGYFIFSILLYFLSYLFSLYLYKRQEL